MESSSVTFVSPEPAEIELMYQTSPYQMNLCDSSGSLHTLETGVKIVTSSQRAHWFAYFWGVDIQVFHQTMLLDWKEIQSKLLDGKLFTDSSLESSSPELCYESEREVTLKASKVSSDDLGLSPRTKFPLVVIMLLHDGDDETHVKLTDAVALICAIHIQDSLCSSNTSFVFKLSKLANGQVLNVSNLYTRDDSAEALVCLICEARRVVIGLLPCRHYSLCEICYNKLPLPKRCPVCRSFVAKYFKHKDLTETPTSSSTVDTCDGDATVYSSEHIQDDLPGPSNWFSRQMSRIFKCD